MVSPCRGGQTFSSFALVQQASLLSLLLTSTAMSIVKTNATSLAVESIGVLVARAVTTDTSASATELCSILLTCLDTTLSVPTLLTDRDRR